MSLRRKLTELAQTALGGSPDQTECQLEDVRIDDAPDPQVVPPEDRPGHERIDFDDPVTVCWQTDSSGREWFVVGDSRGAIRTREPLPVER